MRRETRRVFLKGVGSGIALNAVPGNAVLAGGQNPEVPSKGVDLPPLVQHPQPEIDLPVARDPDQWSRVPAGLHGSFVSKDVVYFRHQVPELRQQVTSQRLVAWQGERVAASLLLYTRTGARQARVRTAPLRGDGGRQIAAERITARFVRYVLTNLPFGSADGNCNPVDPAQGWLMPDILDPEPRFDLAGESARPVWLSIDVPADAHPGLYRTEIRVLSEGGQDLPFTLELEVLPLALPPPQDWRFQLDLWQNPWAVAAHHGVPPWSPAHLEILKPHLKMLGEAGAKFITTYLCHSPWKDDTYTADSTMVEWIRRPDGSWEFDYSIFDRYVELAMECGITQSITCYTPLPWKHRVRFLDARTGDYVWQEWPPTSPEFASFWKTLLADLRRHLVRRGWFDRTYIGINENPLEDTLAAIATVKEDSPDWKLTYAGKWHPELNDLLDDYCVIVDEPPTREHLAARKRAGRTTTFYVCCYPAKPNNYPFSPPAENTWMGWHAAALDYEGFLRWAYDSWTADPLRDTRHVFWPAGDCFLVYPGSRSSIRFERLREGIADFEKIRLLRAQLTERKASEQLAVLDRVLAEFTYAKAQSVPAADIVNAAKATLLEIAVQATK